MQPTTAQPAPKPRPAPPRLRLAQGEVPLDERFQALRGFRGTADGFLRELLVLQTGLAGAAAGWAFLPGRPDAAAAVGAADPAAAERAAALALETAEAGGAREAGHPLPGGAAGWLTALRLGDAGCPTVVLHAPPAAGPPALLTRERVVLTGTLWDGWSRGAAAEALAAAARLDSVPAAAAAEASLEAAALTLATTLIDRLGPGALAAAVGWPGRGRAGVRLVGLAPLSEADPRTRATSSVTAALCEAAAHPLDVADPAAGLAASALCTPAAVAVAAGGDAAGPVLLLGFDPAVLPAEGLAATLERVASSSAAPLRTLARADRRLAGRWPEAAAAGARRCLGRGPGSIGRRLAALALLGGVGFVAAVPVPARVGAGFTAEASGARVVAAAFDGELASVAVHPGDRVTAGETVLGTLATEQFRLELSGLRAERLTHRREADDTRAADPTAARLAELEVARLDGAIALAGHRVRAASLVAPASGVVVSPDLHRRVGTPVTRGETLFEVADPAALAAALAVPEAEAHRVRVGARGRLTPASHPGVSLPVTVTRVHPVAEPGPAGSVVRVEVGFDEAPAWLKPGARGNARIDAGAAPLLWQWIRPTWRAVRLHL